MKIGQFAKKFQVSTATVRYYIELGLIIPIKEGAQFKFDQKNIEDMEFILMLKSFNFNLKDIMPALSIKRLTKFKDPKANEIYKAMLNEKKNDLNNQISDLNNAINQINKQINLVGDLIIEDCNKVSGVPVKMLGYFACPHCGNTLTLNNTTISNGCIISGIMQCPCNYSAKILDGILFADEGENINVPDYSDGGLVKDLSFDLINVQIKSYRWMIKNLSTRDLNEKLFITTDRFAGGFFTENSALLPKNNIYIFVYNSIAALKHLKKRIDAMNLGLDILYILSDTFELPIKENSVDFFIDDLSTSNFLFFHDFYPIEKLYKYLSDRAYIIGSLFLYNKSVRTIKNIIADYTTADVEKLCSIEKYKDALERHQFSLTKLCSLESIENPGEGVEFSFHKKGDKLLLYNYIATKKQL